MRLARDAELVSLRLLTNNRLKSPQSNGRSSLRRVRAVLARNPTANPVNREAWPASRAKHFVGNDRAVEHRQLLRWCCRVGFFDSVSYGEVDAIAGTVVLAAPARKA